MLRRLIPRREKIGPDDCPVISRWTLWDHGWKVMVHWFHPNVEDNPLHDHPWSFYSAVLWGSYQDIGEHWIEVVKAPVWLYRHARHVHRTKAGPRGALTLVIAMPKSREWGFFREGRWWSVKDYAERYGFRDGCD